MIDLDELEKKEKAATPGPWSVSRWRIFDEDEGFELVANGFKLPMNSWTGATDEAEGNAELIAALRNAAPKLIAMARTLERVRLMLKNQASLVPLVSTSAPGSYHRGYDNGMRGVIRAIDAAMQD
jgi:hypothetical protein